jgi:hypothetical protein
MMPSSTSPPVPTPPRPRRDAGVRFTTADELGNQLWDKVLEATGSLEIHGDCAQQRHAIELTPPKIIPQSEFNITGKLEKNINI